MTRPIIVIVLIFAMSFHLKAADSTSVNRKMNFGFNIGTNVFFPTEVYFPGVVLGSNAVYNLNNNIGFAFVPSLTMGEILKPDSATSTEFTYVELPLYLQIKAGKQSIKPLFIAGINYKADLLKPKNSFFAADAGIGIEKQFKKFNLLPLVRYSYARNMQAVYFTLNFMGK